MKHLSFSSKSTLSEKMFPFTHQFLFQNLLDLSSFWAAFHSFGIKASPSPQKLRSSCLRIFCCPWSTSSNDGKHLLDLGRAKTPGGENGGSGVRFWMMQTVRKQLSSCQNWWLAILAFQSVLFSCAFFWIYKMLCTHVSRRSRCAFKNI